MLLESSLPPHLDALLRSAALFAAYTTLMKFDLNPCTYAFVLVLCRAVTLRTLCRERCHSRPLLSKVLHGIWPSFNISCMVVAICKLHPFRAAVGQYASFTIARFNGSARLSTLLLCGLMVLGWANNLTPTHLSIAREDTIHALDSIGGMVALLVYIVSEGLRLHNSRVDETTSNMEAFVSVVYSAVVAALGEQFSSSGNGLVTFYHWGLSSFADGILIFVVPPALWLIVVCIMDSSRQTFRQRVVPIAMQIRVNPLRINESTVVVASVAAFLLHTFYHHHFSPSGGIESESHPMWHIDNIMVLVGAGFITASLGSRRDEESSEGLESGLFDLTPKTNHLSLVQLIRATVWSRPRQRKLFIFFCMTLSFMLVELIYGLHANSLSLVSDSFHMLLDAASIGLGLWTSVIAGWPRSSSYPRGYTGYESISGFINGIALLLVAIWIAWESVERLFDPPHVVTDHLLAVAVGGLVVNVVGVVFFHEAHAHGHSHSNNDGCCHIDETAHQNMRGIYLHIVADLLGSVAVILSTLVIHVTGWTVVDPVCSILISCFIFHSALPLVQQAGAMLSYGIAEWDNSGRSFSELSNVNSVIAVGDTCVRFQCGGVALAAVSLTVLDDSDVQLVQNHSRNAMKFAPREFIVVEALTMP
jgi:cation diffusion facilitator family transporter